MHRDKLQRMGSSIDTKPPAPQPHLTLYGRDYASKKRATTEAAFADLKMIQSIAKTMTRRPNLPDRKGPVSLNADSRKTEIFRIMKENHRLLDRLETLEPIVSTTELLREHKSKHRYTILVSHSKRLAGEYDEDVMRIRAEDKAKTDAMNRSVQARLTKYERNRMQNSGSMSMPSLTPMAATDPGLSMAASSPEPKRRGKPVVKGGQLGGTGGLGSSSSSTRSAPAATSPASMPVPSEDVPAAKSVPDPQAQFGTAKPASRVSFGIDATEDKARSGEFEPPAKTPYARDAPAEMLVEDKVEAVDPPSKPVEEFDPSPEQQPLADANKVGLAGSSPEGAPKLGESMEEASYEQDFADETQTSMSKANDVTGADESFEQSQGQ